MRLQSLIVISYLVLACDAGCPSLFEEYNWACYYIGNNPVGSVHEAFRACYRLGGYLLNIDASLENTHVVERIQQQPTIYDGYWIGGFFNGQYWVWQKTDQSGTVVETFMDPNAEQYKNWGPGQPNAYAMNIYKPYAAIGVRYRPNPYKWYSENEFARTPGGMSYVCEADWKL